MNLKTAEPSLKDTNAFFSKWRFFFISDSGEHKICESLNQNFLVIDYDELEAMGRIKNTTDRYR